MPSFSKTSLDRLNTCHQDLITLFTEVIKYYDCTVVCGHRGEEEQNKAFAEGKSKKKWPNSNHNVKPSEAVDVSPYEKGGIDWSWEQGLFFAGFVLGISERLYAEGKIKHKIRSGVDWNDDRNIHDTTFKDAPHFEIIKK